MGATRAVERGDVPRSRLRLEQRRQGLLRRGRRQADVVVGQVVVRALAVVLAAAWVLTGLGGVAAAGPGALDLESVARRLAAPATQKGALGELAASSDPAVERLLRALKDGALYVWKGRLVILGDDAGLTDVAGRPLLDAQGQPAQLGSGQEAVALDESHFGVVQRILERFEVLGKDPAKRQSAAFKLGTSGDSSAIPVLARAIEGETNRDVRAALEDSSRGRSRARRIATSGLPSRTRSPSSASGRPTPPTGSAPSSSSGAAPRRRRCRSSRRCSPRRPTRRCARRRGRRSRTSTGSWPSATS